MGRITIKWEEGFKFGFIGEFEPPITSVGSDALVAPKPQTFCFLMGKKIVCQEEIGGFPV